jgi:osmoprotectant transport system permease protein
VTLSGTAAPPAGAIARRIPLRLHNHVLPVLVAATAAAVLTAGFVTVAPNRLVSGRSVALWNAAEANLAAGIAAAGALLLAAALTPPRRALHRAAAAVAAILLLLVLAAAGQAAAALKATSPGLVRISLGAAFWVLIVAAGLAVIDGVQRAAAGAAARLMTAAMLAGIVALMAQAGLFDALSLAREFQARRGFFFDALLRHIVLVAASVGPALLIGVPLGIAAARRPRWQGGLFAVLNLLQTVPSIALFGLLMVPLAALAAALPWLARIGIGGIGMAPAIIALILYALLPIVRNSLAGISGVDPAIVEAARGMGMTRRQLLWSVELPLALPVFLAGLRIVVVQTIGLAVVAALIGAGGLGSFVFEGLGQYAADLVLLGALTAILLALAVDFLLQTVAAALQRGGAA